jgi:hypothetical protein
VTYRWFYRLDEDLKLRVHRVLVNTNPFQLALYARRFPPAAPTGISPATSKEPCEGDEVLEELSDQAGSDHIQPQRYINQKN